MPIPFKPSLGFCLALLLAILLDDVTAVHSQANREREVCMTFFGSTKRAHVRSTTTTYTTHVTPTVFVTSHSTNLITPSPSTVTLTDTATTVAIATQSTTDIFTSYSYVSTTVVVTALQGTQYTTATSTSTVFSEASASMPTTFGFQPIQSTAPSLTYVPPPVAPPPAPGINADPASTSHVARATSRVRRAVPEISEQHSPFNFTSYPASIRCRLFTTVYGATTTRARQGAVMTSTLATSTATTAVLSTATVTSTTVLTANATAFITSTLTYTSSSIPPDTTVTATTTTSVTAVYATKTSFAQCETSDYANYANSFKSSLNYGLYLTVENGLYNNFAAVAGVETVTDCCGFCAAAWNCGTSAFNVLQNTCYMSFTEDIQWGAAYSHGVDTIYSNGWNFVSP